MMRRVRLVRAGAALVAVAVLSGCAWIGQVDAPRPGTGTTPNRNAGQYWPSQTGRYVVFASAATNLVDSTANEDPVFAKVKVFLRDNKTKTTALLHSNATLGLDPSVSRDLRYVLLQELGIWKVLDRTTGSLGPVAFDAQGSPVPNGASSATISANGRYVALRQHSRAEAPEGWLTYISDLQSHTTRLVSSVPGTPQNVWWAHFSDALTLSDDGSVLTQSACVASTFQDPFPVCTSWGFQIWDLTNGTVETPLFDQPTSFQARLDGDGHLVVYSDGTHVWAYSRPTHTRQLVDVGFDGRPATGRLPSVSTNGRYVAFESSAPNLNPAPGGPAGLFHVYVRDLTLSSPVVADVPLLGPFPGTGRSRWPVISGDGRYVAFQSNSTNLAPGATSVAERIYVKAVSIPRIASAIPTSGAAGTTNRITVTGHGFRPDITFLVRNPTTVLNVANLAVTETSLQMDVTIPAGAPTGAYDIYVYNPGGGPGSDTGAGGSCLSCFHVTP